MQVTIYTYDVWGNEDDGFDVNDVFTYGTYDLEDASDEGIIAFLNEHFFKNAQTLETINLDNLQQDTLWIELEQADNGKPIGRIVAKDEG